MTGSRHAEARASAESKLTNDSDWTAGERAVAVAREAWETAQIRAGFVADGLCTHKTVGGGEAYGASQAAELNREVVAIALRAADDLQEAYAARIEELGGQDIDY